MEVSKNCINIIKKYEGCKLQAYKCPAGVWTIGYGHTVGVKMGDLITQEQADVFLLSDIKKFEQKVEKYDRIYHFNQNEFDALVSFSFNIGNIDTLTANGTRGKQEIPKKMLLYVKANGVVLNGLKKRRKEEVELFNKESTPEQRVEGGVVKFSLKRDGKDKISENFKISEFKCKDGSDEILIDVDFVRTRLQKIRDYFGDSVIINSAYRTKEYNEKVGGAKNSYHVKGRAFDIVVRGKTVKEVAKYASSIGIKGVMQYPTFVHVDSRENKYWAKVENGKATSVSYF